MSLRPRPEALRTKFKNIFLTCHPQEHAKQFVRDLIQQRLRQVLKPTLASLSPVRIQGLGHYLPTAKAFEITREIESTRTTPSLPRRSVVIFTPVTKERHTSAESKAHLKYKDASWVSGSHSMTSHVDIITSPTADTPGACLYLHFDKRRYLFGRLSEGTQRAFNQRKMSASSLEQIFLTGEVNWATMGGMMGLLLTVSDVILGAKDALAETNKERRQRGLQPISKESLERLDIHGAENLTYTLATARNFIFRTGMPFRTFELLEDRRMTNPENLEPDYKDDCVNVWKVPIHQKSKKRKHDEADGKGMDGDQPTEKKLKAEDKKTLCELVESMFNSSWRMDTLLPTKLHDVVLPAKIFVKGQDKAIRRYEGPLPGDAADVPNIDVLVREPWPATKVNSLPQTSYSSQSMCYIVKNHARRGKFNAKLAIELGVAPQDNKRLIRGETVPGKDGKMVTPDMVVAADIKGKGFAIVDIPDHSYLESFFARPEWANEQLLDSIGAMYWVLGKGVITNPDVQQFMKARSSIKHISLSPDTCPNMLALESYAGLHAKLGRIDPARFPMLEFKNTVPDLGIPDHPYVMGRVGKRVKTMPYLQFEDNDIVPFYSTANAISTITNNKIFKLAEEAAARASDPDFLAQIEEAEKDIPNRDAEIIALGTGSAMPSKYRNVSATLIRVPGIGNYLLDCGENTLGQIRRAFGFEEAARIMKDLRCIFISHMHADHHLGTASVISAWQNEVQGQSTLAISCTYFMRRFLEEYSQVQHLDLNKVRFFGDSHSDSDYTYTFPENDPSGLSEIARVRVDHCKSAHAGLLVWPSGLKIAYSGDCRPSSAFAQRAKGAHLLIHEATFEDDKALDAIAKKHSTMSEAVAVAEEMQARRVLLTHFSQRYAKGGGESEEMKGDHRVVLNAFDLMRVKLGEFRVAEVFLPAIRMLLEEENGR